MKHMPDDTSQQFMPPSGTAGQLDWQSLSLVHEWQDPESDSLPELLPLIPEELPERRPPPLPLPEASLPPSSPDPYPCPELLEPQAAMKPPHNTATPRSRPVVEVCMRETLSN